MSLASIGDSLDRYLLRLNEIIESCRIVYGMQDKVLIYGFFDGTLFLFVRCYSFIGIELTVDRHR